MARKISGRRLIFIATAIVVVVTALWAVVIMPRLGVHPQAIKDGAADSSRVFFSLLGIAAVVLAVCVILSRTGGRVISGVLAGLLYLAAGLLALHAFTAFEQASFFLESYEGFRGEAILMLVGVAADLIALILAIKAGNTYRQSAKANGEEGTLPL